MKNENYKTVYYIEKIYNNGCKNRFIETDLMFSNDNKAIEYFVQKYSANNNNNPKSNIISGGCLMSTNYSLMTNDNSKLIIKDINHSIEDAKTNNPYNTTAIITVVSGDFSGIGEFEFDIKDFREFIIDLSKAYDTLEGSIVLNDIGYGSKITFEFRKTGQVDVSGIIYGSARIHTLEFEFRTDQTAFLHFIKELYKDWIE